MSTTNTTHSANSDAPSNANSNGQGLAQGEPPRRIVMLAYEDAQILDITGPLEVFATTSRLLAEQSGDAATAAYEIELVADVPGPVRMSSGLELIAQRSLRDSGRDQRPFDSLVVPGGIGTERALRNRDHIAWIQTLAPRARRVAARSYPRGARSSRLGPASTRLAYPPGPSGRPMT